MTTLRPREIIIFLRFLQRPRKQSQGNQIIHRGLVKTKLIGGELKIIGSRSRPKGTRQADSSGSNGEGGKGRGGIGIRFVQQQCFQLWFWKSCRDRYQEARFWNKQLAWIICIQQSIRTFQTAHGQKWWWLDTIVKTVTPMLHRWQILPIQDYTLGNGNYKCVMVYFSGS